MPELATALASLFDGGDVTIFQATVSAVGTGVATVSYNGGEFTQVPFLLANYGGGQTYPSNSQKVYVVARKGWGMLIIGSPPPGPVRSISSGVTRIWAASVLATYYPTGPSWAVASSNQFTVGSGTTAVEIFGPSLKPSIPSTGLSSAGISINVLSAESGSFLGGGAYLTMGLHANSSPSGPLVKVAGTSESHIYLNVNDPKYVTIPIDWASRLIAGTASGIYLQAEGGVDSYDITTLTMGEIQMAFL